MTSEQLARLTPAKYATFRALRPRLLLLLGFVLLSILIIGRWQRVEAQSHVETAGVVVDGWR